ELRANRFSMPIDSVRRHLQVLRFDRSLRCPSNRGPSHNARRVVCRPHSLKLSAQTSPGTAVMTRASILFACLSLGLVGCGAGADGPPMYAVSGLVTFDGQPVEKGRILFRQTDGD